MRPVPALRRAAPAALLLLLVCCPPAPAAVIDPSLYGGSSETLEALSADAAAPTEGSAEEQAQAGESRVKISGRYRLAAGVDSDYDFLVTEANADQQERNFRYLFGERLNNTYDPAIYSQYLLNVEFTPYERFSFYTQAVADPWSWVGTTGEQIVRSDIGTEELRYNLKFFGSNRSVLNEIYRTNVADSVGFPVIEVKDGRTVRTEVHGFFDFSPATNGVPFQIPEHDIDFEFRPIRKLWMDYTEEDWHLRLFALADERQALSTDDPLGLSNHRDFWQQSPWLYQYVPIQHFSDGSIKRGYYSDSLSFLARDSEGNRLVLLRGVSAEANLGDTYLVGTVAAPYTPWDEDYFDADNVPGAFRIKHRATDRLMVGGTYTFRTGLIDGATADFAQVGGVDTRYDVNEHVNLTAEMAVSHRERDIMTNDLIRADSEGYAYKGQVEADFDHAHDGHSLMRLSYAQMDRKFDPVLSRYSNTRDDKFWGKHLSFADYSPDLEAFRLGDGLDIDRVAVRFHWKEKMFKDRFYNLFDVRHVRVAEDGSFKENVLREEATLKVTEKLTVKGLFRWHKLPRTYGGVEPFISDYYFIGFEDPSTLKFQNVAVPPDQDPSRFTYAGGLQYVFTKHWTGEVFYERTNDIPDFPRGLLNGTFRDANDRVDGLLIDHLTNFLYRQGPFGAAPPYEYFTITRQRLIWQPEDRVRVTFHAAQNSYRFAAGIDDNVNHQGVGVRLDPAEKWTLFFDYTHSRVADVPRLIATNYIVTETRDHHNVYASLDYRINSKTVFRAEYGVFGLGLDSPLVTPYSATTFALPTLDTEHLFRVSLTGDF